MDRTWSVDRYLCARDFDRKDYNCLHFTRDVWLDLTGRDIGEALEGLLGGEEGRVRSGMVRAFERLRRPEDPCLVVMQRPRSSPHAGVYLRGSVLHMHEMGVEYLPVEVASRGFAGVRYYRCSA